MDLTVCITDVILTLSAVLTVSDKDKRVIKSFMQNKRHSARLGETCESFTEEYAASFASVLQRRSLFTHEYI